MHKQQKPSMQDRRVAIIIMIIAVAASITFFAAIFAGFGAVRSSSQALTIQPNSADNALAESSFGTSKPNEGVNSILGAFSASPQIRADILISAKRNDGTPIENERFEEIRTELATRFGGVTVLPRFNGTSIRDGIRNDGTNNSGFFVVVQNNQQNIEWLIEYKQILKERLNQDRIFMTFSPTAVSP
jgi:hypothetical protein